MFEKKSRNKRGFQVWICFGKSLNQSHELAQNLKVGSLHKDEDIGFELLPVCIEICCFFLFVHTFSNRQLLLTFSLQQQFPIDVLKNSTRNLSDTEKQQGNGFIS